ncbi:MAG: hypothetical protein V4735_04165 [Pseudomonadota bacterium]
MIRSLKQHKALWMLGIESIAAGAVAILFLHYCIPFAEHPRMLNTFGLLLDIVGVTYIAYDIFPFKGVEEYGADDIARSGIETPEYKAFKRAHVSFGLRIVVIGFFFQILAYWVEELKVWLP